MAGENCNINKDEAEILKPSSPTSTTSPPKSSSPPPSLFLKPSAQEFSAPERPQMVEKPVIEAVAEIDAHEDARSSCPKPEEVAEPVRFSNRCSCCRKKVGLTGFRCRCSELFCGQHRYSDAHDCTFDYKTAGREQISKANPLIRAAKIIKI